MSKQIVIQQRNIDGVPVKYSVLDKMYFATDYLKVYNSKHRTQKRFVDFWGNSSTETFLKSKKAVKKTSRGRGGGTWLSEGLFNYFTEWINGYAITNHDRKENIFFRRLVDICFSDEIKQHDFKLQYQVENYKIDFSLKSRVNNEDYFLLLEYDEKYHDKYKDNDLKREQIISKALFKSQKELHSIMFVRIPEHKENIALKYLIPYISGIETSYSLDKIESMFDTRVYFS